MSKKKIIIVAAGVIIVAGIAIWTLGGKAKNRKVVYETTTVGRADISNFVTATGTIEPVTEVEVGTQVSGIIDKLYADYNSVVTKGQLIAEMDKVTLQSELALQKATYAAPKPNTNISRRTTNATKACTRSSSSETRTTSRASITIRKPKVPSTAVRLRSPRQSATSHTPPSPRPSTALSSAVT